MFFNPNYALPCKSARQFRTVTAYSIDEKIFGEGVWRRGSIFARILVKKEDER
jgi:hypothetical protein